MPADPTTLYIGIDPGTPPTMAVLYHPTGATAFYEGEELGFGTLRVTPKGKPSSALVTSPELIAETLRRLIFRGTDKPIPHLVTIERVSIRPGEALASGQRFVGSMYMAVGICQGMKLEWRTVPPSVWKRDLNVPGKMLDDGNDQVRRVAVQHFPNAAASLSRKKDHNRAEALLLAHWGKEYGLHAPRGLGGM